MAHSAADITDRLYSLAGCQDPYAIYREIIDGPPLQPGGGGLLAVHHEAVVSILRDARFGHPEVEAPPGETLEQRISRTIFIKRNPPDHTFLRSMVSKAFTPRAVRELVPSVEKLVRGLLDGLADRGGGADLLHDFATPLPVTVIANLFAIPEADRRAFRTWSQQLVGPQGESTADQQYRSHEAGVAFASYLRNLVEERRKKPGDDLVSQLAAASSTDGRFTPDDVIATCQLLLFAGHETTVNLIANGVLALIRHPDARGRVVADPHLTATAVEELLRYDGPVHLTARTALEPATICDIAIPEGERVTILLGAANRDPRRFTDPDRLVVERDPNPHVGFGLGIHFCLGAPLARMEAQVAIPALLRRFPSLDLAGDVAWRHSLMLRGMSAMPVQGFGT